MFIAEGMDEFGKVGWIAAVVAGFWWHWPIGLAILMFLAFSGRLRAWRYAARGRWYNYNAAGPARGCGWGWRSAAAPQSGNHAFDDYRAETLRRLEEEQQEFVAYLERLRKAKDKAEFDQFMAERRPRPPAPEQQPGV